MPDCRLLAGILLVSWCFKPSQPQRIISGLRETFIKRYIVERTNKAEIRPEEQRKRRDVGRLHGLKYSWKGHKDRNRHRSRIKRSGQAELVYVKDINRNIPTTWRWARGIPDPFDRHGIKTQTDSSFSIDLLTGLFKTDVWKSQKHGRERCHCLSGGLCLWRHETPFSSSSAVDFLKCEPTWPCPVVLKFEAEK